MNYKILTLTIAAILFAAAGTATDGLYMEPLKVSPEEPNTKDTISVQATAYSPSSFEYLEFYVDGERKDRSLCSNSLTFPTSLIDLPFGCSKTFNFEPGSSGSYDIEVRAASPFGVSKRTSTVEVKDTSIETAPPTINSIEFSPAQPLPGEQVDINVIASDNSPTNLLGLESIQISAEGENIGGKICDAFSRSCQKGFSYTPDTSGSKTITAKVTAADGQTAQKEKILYVREELASSGVTGEVSNPVTIYAETTEGVDSSEYRCYWDDSGTVTESDNEMERDGERFEDQEDFEEGDHEIHIRCFRDGSATNTVTASFSIEENSEPEADLEIEPDEADIDEEVTFDASESEDDDGDIEEYEWDFENDGDYDETTSDDDIEESFDSQFDGKAKVRVTDDDGDTDTATASYTVGSHQCSMTDTGLKLSRTEADTGDTVEAWIEVENTGENSQDVTAVLEEDGNEFYSRTRTLDQDESYNFSGEFEATEDTEVRSTVTASSDDCDEQEYTDKIDLEVNTEGINAAFDFEPSDPEADEDVEFDASDSYSENDIDRYRWDFDDGNSRLGETTTHSFEDDGEYDVELEIEDEEGETDTETKTVEVGESDDTGTLEIEVTDENNDEIEDARVRVRNGETETERTDRDGEAEFELKEDEYEVEVSKNGYSTETRTVAIEPGETRELEIELEELRNSEMKVRVTDGFSSLNDVRITADGQTRYTSNGRTEFELGEGEYTVKASKAGYRTVSKFVKIRSSESRTISFELEETDEESEKTVTMKVNPSKVNHGESVKVEGYVDGGKGRSQVEISHAGRTLQTVSTQPDGYFQSFVTPTAIGNHNMKVQTGETSASTPVEVQSTVSISGLEAPRKVFEGSEFEICVRVESQRSATLRLYNNGEQLDTKTSRGNTCFSTDADEGEQEYRIVAVTPGDSDTATRTVEVLPMDQEVTSFPDNIAAVETESGIIKVNLYNTHEDQRRYDLEMSNIQDTWISKTDEQVILNKGERETVYFYLNGREEGTYSPTLTVSSDGNTVYRKDLNVEIGGTKSKRKGGFISRLQGLIPF